MELAALIANVESAIRTMGLSDEESKADENGQWILLKNEMPVYLDAWEDKESTPWNYFVFNRDATVFQVTIPFVLAPTLRKNEFIQELLVVNLNLLYGKFSFNEKDNASVLTYRVPGHHFKSEDLETLIDGLAYYAEMAYHVLKDEFGLKRIHPTN
jgi:hypothetical protein